MKRERGEGMREERKGKKEERRYFRDVRPEKKRTRCVKRGEK